MEIEYLGIDPGAKGCAWSIGTFNQEFRFANLTEAGLYSCIDTLHTMCHAEGIKLFAVLERQMIRPSDAKANAMKLIDNYGMLRGFLIASGIPHVKVMPAVWYRKMGRIDPKGTKKSEKKRRNQQLAEELFPDRKFTRETADAILLAEYGRRFCDP